MSNSSDSARAKPSGSAEDRGQGVILSFSNSSEVRVIAACALAQVASVVVKTTTAPLSLPVVHGSGAWLITPVISLAEQLSLCTNHDDGVESTELPAVVRHGPSEPDGPDGVD